MRSFLENGPGQGDVRAAADAPERSASRSRSSCDCPDASAVRHNRAELPGQGHTGRWRGAAPLQEDTCDEAPCERPSWPSRPVWPSPPAARAEAVRQLGHGGSGANAATATSAQALGGMDALVKAAKAEGTLNVIALPPDWANYGAMLKAFTDKYGIKINSALPGRLQPDELDAVTSQKGQDRAPDVLDVGTSFALQAAGAEAARALPGGHLGGHPRQPEGRRRATGTTTTAASSRSAATPRR